MNDRTSELLRGVYDALKERLYATHNLHLARLSQAARRLRSFESEEQWSSILLDAAQGFCDRAALFTIHGNTLHFQGSRNLAAMETGDVPLGSAPAFASAVESRETVVALRTAGELSPSIATYLSKAKEGLSKAKEGLGEAKEGVGEAADQKFCLFPIVTRERVVALLYADGENQTILRDALELLTVITGAMIENSTSNPKNGLVNLAGSVDDPHLQARCFARVKVADIRLHKSESVKNGRAERDLYASLKEEIDSAREGFRRDFLSVPDSMVDYLHLELVKTLANDDVGLLGPNYPGPLV